MLLGSFFAYCERGGKGGAECEVFWGSSCSALRLVSWQACFWQEARGYLHRSRRRSAVRTFGTFLNARLCVHTTLACRGIWTAPRPGCWKLLNYFSIARFFCCSSRAVGLLLSVRVMSHAFVQVVVVVVVLLCFFLNFYFGANRAVLLTTFKRCSFVFFFFSSSSVISVSLLLSLWMTFGAFVPIHVFVCFLSFYI